MYFYKMCTTYDELFSPPPHMMNYYNLPLFSQTFQDCIILYL